MGNNYSLETESLSTRSLLSTPSNKIPPSMGNNYSLETKSQSTRSLLSTLGNKIPPSIGNIYSSWTKSTSKTRRCKDELRNQIPIMVRSYNGEQRCDGVGNKIPIMVLYPTIRIYDVTAEGRCGEPNGSKSPSWDCIPWYCATFGSVQGLGQVTFLIFENGQCPNDIGWCIEVNSKISKREGIQFHSKSWI